MKKATQQDVDTFLTNVMNDENIYPFISGATYIGKIEPHNDDWHGLTYVSDNHQCLLIINFDHTRILEASIGLWSTSAYQAGRALLIVKEMIKRYKPRAINSTVHSSNVKSLAIHNKIFGLPYGIMEDYAWNMLMGKFEDMHCFRMLLTKNKSVAKVTIPNEPTTYPNDPPFEMDYQTSSGC